MSKSSLPLTLFTSRLPLSTKEKENRPVTNIATGRLNSGNDLLSRALETHYHRRCRVSLPGSRWDRVGPRLSGHQTTVPLGGFPSRKRTSSDRQLLSKNPGGGSLTTAQEIKFQQTQVEAESERIPFAPRCESKKLSESSAGGPAPRRRRTASRKILRSSQLGN